MTGEGVRLWRSPDGSYYRTYPGMIHTDTAYPAARAEAMARVVEAAVKWAACCDDETSWHESRVIDAVDAYLKDLPPTQRGEKEAT